jgi:transcriptional regulator
MYVNPQFAERRLSVLHDAIEATRPFADAPVEDLARLLPRLAAFTMRIDAIQGKRKLSQNRSPEDRDGVVDGLRQRAADDDLAIAAAMADRNMDQLVMFLEG